MSFLKRRRQVKCVVELRLGDFEAVQEEIERLRSANEEKSRAINGALDELGIPDSGYPAPVANAVDLLSAAVIRRRSEEMKVKGKR